MHLFVRGGSFAFVRMRLPDKPSACGDCAKGALTFIRELAARKYGHDPSIARRGLDHETSVGTLHSNAGTVEMYLFTDGAASLTLDIPALRGSRRVRAGGKIRGQVRRLPLRCVAAGGCDQPYAGNGSRGGGAVYDVGKLGHAEGWAMSHQSTPRSGQSLYNAARVCHSPGYASPDSSPEPRDHPTGCDVVPSSASDQSTAVENINSVGGPDSGTVMAYWRNNARGRAYVGAMVTYHGTNAATQRAWGLWYANGIA